MIKVHLLPLVAIAYTLNYLNLSTDGVIIGGTDGILIILSEHPDGDFTYAQINCCKGDLPFAKYTQESLYQLRSEFTAPIPTEATIMPGAILVGEKVIALEGEPHGPVELPVVGYDHHGPMRISSRMMITASHICQTFEVESAEFLESTIFTVEGAAFALVVRGDRIG